jgi:aryl-alcohol dehydrogenase-like predicted oxidoreductase
MEQRRFGDSDLWCAPLGFGTWEMGSGQSNYTKYGQIDHQEAIRAVHAALDAGVNLFDTAAIYGPGTSEELLAEALGPRRKDVLVVTKVGFGITEDRQVYGKDNSRAAMLAQADQCLQRLKTDYVDIIMLHWHDHKTPIAEVMGTLEQIRLAGKCRHIGICNFSVPMLRECERSGRLTAVQVGYHLFDRRAEAELLPYCLEKGIGFMSYGTLGFGLCSGALTRETRFLDWDWRSKGKAFGLPLFEGEDYLRELAAIERLKALAARFDRSMAQLAIAWAIGHPAVTVSLVGVRRPSELVENVRAADWVLSPEVRAEVDRILAEEGIATYADRPELQAV